MLEHSIMWRRDFDDTGRQVIFEMWIWRRMQNIIWTDTSRNKSGLEKLAKNIKMYWRKESNLIGTYIRTELPYCEQNKGDIKGKRKRERKNCSYWRNITQWANIREWNRKCGTEQNGSAYSDHMPVMFHKTEHYELNYLSYLL